MRFISGVLLVYSHSAWASSEPALIKAGGVVIAALVAAVIPGVTAWLISLSQKKRKAMETKYRAALSDLAFYIALERFHVRHHKEVSGQSNKNRIRQQVLQETELMLSGQFSGSKIQAELEKLR